MDVVICIFIVFFLIIRNEKKWMFFLPKKNLKTDTIKLLHNPFLNAKRLPFFETVKIVLSNLHYTIKILNSKKNDFL